MREFSLQIILLEGMEKLQANENKTHDETFFCL